MHTTPASVSGSARAAVVSPNTCGRPQLPALSSQEASRGPAGGRAGSSGHKCRPVSHQRRTSYLSVSDSGSDTARRPPSADVMTRCADGRSADGIRHVHSVWPRDTVTHSGASRPAAGRCRDRDTAPVRAVASVTSGSGRTADMEPVLGVQS